jgi:hypothetical protein
MFESFLRTIVKVAIASLIVGAILTHFGITVERVTTDFGLSPDRVEDLVRRAFAWALPNMLLGGLVIAPLWFLAFLLRPPRRSE